MISLLHFVILGIIVFLIGVLGIFLNRRSIISLIMSIEIMLIAVNLNFAVFANYIADLKGHVFVLFILSVAAAEVSIMLVALVVYHKNRGTTLVDDLRN